jgi:hypothetical protein
VAWLGCGLATLISNHAQQNILTEKWKHFKSCFPR